MRRFLPFVCFLSLLSAQVSDPAYPVLSEAYQKLKEKNYDSAVRLLEQGLQIAPDRVNVRKDLAYAYLKVGETIKARDQFADVMRRQPADDQVALEFAYLAFETGQKVEARRVFQRLSATSLQAKATFESIDRPLREGIARWTEIIAKDPDNFSAHQELAKLAEERDELEVAAQHYREAWRLRPDIRATLLDLGRVCGQSAGHEAEGFAALLAASRGPDSYTAEKARALLPSRYPFVYEFEQAIRIDPANTALRRELAYLLLAMNEAAQARQAFQRNVEAVPGDTLSMAQLGLLELKEGDHERGISLLQQVMRSPDVEVRNRVAPVLLPELARRDRDLGLRSLDQGYLKDAVKYLTAAYENNPKDYEVMLKLGWAHNLLKQDENAIEWFRLAKESADPKVAAEAKRAYRNLNPGRWQTTLWLFPLYSSRWSSGFGYGQAKVELRKSPWALKPYASVRFSGDTRGGIGPVQPQYLSESSVIFAGGVSTRYWHHLVGWAEAGVSVNYLPGRSDLRRAMPDYRAGVAHSQGWGALLDGEAKGWFVDTVNNAVFLSRFDHNTLLMTQDRAGYTWKWAQLFWHGNLTGDVKQQAWANFTETGPGVRFRLSRQAHVTTSYLNGWFLKGGVAPIGSTTPRTTYHDVRVGLWYAFTR